MSALGIQQKQDIRRQATAKLLVIHVVRTIVLYIILLLSNEIDFEIVNKKFIKNRGIAMVVSGQALVKVIQELFKTKIDPKSIIVIDAFYEEKNGGKYITPRVRIKLRSK